MKDLCTLPAAEALPGSTEVPSTSSGQALQPAKGAGFRMTRAVGRRKLAETHLGRLCTNSSSTWLNFSGSSMNRAWPSPSKRSN